MRRAMQVLARMYPAEWRARYGAEYAALLDEREPRWHDVVDVGWAAVKLWSVNWRLVRVVLPCVIAGGLVALAVAWVRPAMYTSGTVVVSQELSWEDGSATAHWPPIPEIARNAFADQEAMERIIRKYNLYPRERAKSPMDQVVETMRSAILIRPASSSVMAEGMRQNEKRTVYDAESKERMDRFERSVRAAFTIEFEYPDPRVAQRVDAELISLITGANLRSAEESAAAGRPRNPGTIAVLNPPRLPDKPDGLNRVQMGLVGLLGGLVCGVIGSMLAASRRRRVLAMGLVLLGMLGGVTASGQVVQSTGPLPNFEVATIKPIQEGAPLPPPTRGAPNIVRMFGGTARDIVRIAYGLPPSRASERVLGGPAWIDTTRYDVEGKIPDALFAEIQKLPAREQGNQRSLMIQAMLRDRFKLVAHVETREMPMYELVVAKNGPRLTPAKELPPDESGAAPPPLPPPSTIPKPENMRQGLMVLRKSATVMEMTAKGQPLDALANQPFFSLDGPIANKTGLTGKYDFVLDWSPEQPASSDASADADAPALFTALQEQLGLKLVPTKGPVEVIMIDHIEPPTAN